MPNTETESLNKAEMEARRWKAIALALALVAALAMTLPQLQSNEHAQEPVTLISNKTHGVTKIATIDITPGKISPIKRKP